MKKKMLQVVHSLPIAGAEILAAKMAKVFQSEYETAICCLDEKGELAAQLEREGIQVFCLSRKAGKDIKTVWRLRQLYDCFQPDLVHAHQYTPYFYSALAKKNKIKLLFTEHGRHYPDIVKWPRKLLNQWLQYRADWVGAVCEFSKKRLAEKEGFTGCPIEVIYNGVAVNGVAYNDPSKTRKELKIPLTAKVVGYAGGLRAIKNPQLLLSAFSCVSKRFDDLYLIYVGDGDLRAQLEQKVHSLGIQNRVIFCGFRYPIYPYLKVMDLYVLPSLSEGASVTLLEAMVAKVPVLVTDVGGNAEIVENQTHGLIVPSEDAAKMAEGIQLLYNDLSQLRRFAEAAYLRVCEKFTEEKMLCQYKNAYETFS